MTRKFAFRLVTSTLLIAAFVFVFINPFIASADLTEGFDEAPRRRPSRAQRSSCRCPRR